MTCVSFPVTNYFGCGFFVILLVASSLVRNARGSHMRHITSRLVYYMLELMIVWYSAAIFGHLCWTNWSRDDFEVINVPLLPFIQATTVCVFLGNLLLFKPNAESLDVLVHTLVAITCNGFLFLSVMVFHHNERIFWIFASISFALLSLYHMLRGSHIYYTGRPRFVRMLVFLLILYYIIYFCSTIMSPLHQGVISFGAFEIIMLCNNVFILCVFSIIVLMYGWAIRHQPPSKLLSLGRINAFMSSVPPNHNFKTERDHFHTKIF